jgi:hypothetical protein
MIFTRKWPCLLVAVLLLCFPSIGLSVPPFSLKPKLTTGWRIDTNYFKEETNETEVHTYLVQPGFDFSYETAKSLILLNYTLDAHYFDEKDSPSPGNQTDDLVGHTLSLKSRTKPFVRVTLGLDESFYKTNFPVYTDIISNRQTREEYAINRLTPRLLYEFGRRLTAGVRYRRTDLEYASGNQEDSTEHRGIFNLIHNLSPRASLDLQYQRWDMSYDLNTPDYTSDQVELIFKKQFQYLSFAAGAGYHERDFDDPGIRSVDVFSYRLDLEAQNPPAPAQKRSHVRFSVMRDFNIYAEFGDYYAAQRYILEAGHVFKEKLPAKIILAYQNSPYERFTGLTPSGDRREDDTYGIQASLGYIWTDWLTVSASAGYEDRDSNLTGFDYENEYLLINLNFSYDLGSK